METEKKTTSKHQFSIIMNDELYKQLACVMKRHNYKNKSDLIKRQINDSYIQYLTETSV